MINYILTTEAEEDVRNIIRYTRKKWGVTQVRRYIAGLEEGMNSLATGRGYFKDMSGIFPELRLVHCQHHYIFGLPQKGAPMLIIAIFHEKMELMAKLSNRINIGFFDQNPDR